MNYAWTTNWRNIRPGADLGGVDSPGLLGELQIAAAQVLDEHVIFGGGRMPIVLQSQGDFLAEMRKKLAEGSAMGLLVMTPDFRQESGNLWAATVAVQVIEQPAINRAKMLSVTCQRAAELVIASLRDRELIPGVWSRFRPNMMPVQVQNSQSTVSWQASGVTKTIVRTS